MGEIGSGGGGGIARWICDHGNENGPYVSWHHDSPRGLRAAVKVTYTKDNGQVLSPYSFFLGHLALVLSGLLQVVADWVVFGEVVSAYVLLLSRNGG